MASIPSITIIDISRPIRVLISENPCCCFMPVTLVVNNHDTILTEPGLGGACGGRRQAETAAHEVREGHLLASDTHVGDVPRGALGAELKIAPQGGGALPA